MNALSKYWNIWRIRSANERQRYQCYVVPTAQEFIEKQQLNTSTEVIDASSIQSILLSQFRAPNSKVACLDRAQAGLCLRCYISAPLLKACQKIGALFGSDKSFTYEDLLPFVLNDDGKTLVILDGDNRTQLVLDPQGNAQITRYPFFSIEVLRTYQSNSPASMSLDNWIFLKTKQNSELRHFLSEFGFKQLSDWALLNRVRSTQVERLSERDRHLIEVFHAVYRRDRAQHHQNRTRKCPNPSDAQLQEMLARLQERKIVISTPNQLLEELKHTAIQLRQYDIWSYREPLEIQDPDTESYVLRSDLPAQACNEIDLDQQEMLVFLHQQLKQILAQAIEKEIDAAITRLKNSTRYRPFASKFIPGLQLYYGQNLSLKEIAPRLGMTSWDQARRVLNPGELLNKIRTLTVQQFLDRILSSAQAKGFTQSSPEPDYLKNLSEQVEAFVDAEIFQEAVEEIRAGKHRSMDSVYAQHLRLCMKQHLKVLQPQ